MDATKKFIGFSIITISLLACGGDRDSKGSSPDEPGPTRQEEVTTAIDKVVSPQAAISNCRVGTAACDAEVSALVESVHSNLSDLVDVSLEDFSEVVEYGVDYAVGLGDSFSDLEIVYEPADTELDEPLALSRVDIPRSDEIRSDVMIPILNDNADIPADEEKAGLAPDGEAGWYYSNSPSAKVNWYFYADFGDYDKSYAVSDLQALTALVTHFNPKGYYFFNLYTLPQNDGNDASSWYRSRLNLVLNRSGVMAGQTYLGHYERTPAAHDTAGHLPIQFVLSSSRLSGVATTIDDINSETIMLISFSTASGRPAGTNHFLLREIKLELAGDIFSYLPIAFSEPVFSDSSFNAVLGNATSAYMEIAAASELFNGLALNITNEKGFWRFACSDSLALTNAVQVLMQKLDRGQGKNALAPALNFVADTTGLQLDVGATLGLEDIANLSATIYADSTKSSVLGAITIAADGRSTTVIK